LKGNGKGEFTPVAPKQSGLVISEDAKSVAMVDLDKDGWLDVVAGINDGALRVFRNKGAGEGMMISVELQGAKGNRTGVGSKVIAHYADGSSLTREVYAGGGYLSQGPASIAYGVPSGNAIEKIEVKWADGKVSGSPVEAGSSKVTINHP